MGTWEGHISPGVAFYSFGILFCFQNSWAYFTGNGKTRIEFSPLCKRCNKFPIESIMKIIYGVGAASAELFYPPGTNKLRLTGDDNRFVHIMEWQHFCMYLSFAISGVVDLVNKYAMKNKAIALEKAAVTLAFYNTTLLLFFHMDGKPAVENKLHTLLMYASIGMCFTVTIEIWRPNDKRLIWIHTFFIMQMGSWLFNAAFILYPRTGEKWDSTDMRNMMMLPVFYCWHIFFNTGMMALIHLIVYLIYKHYNRKQYHSIEDAEMSTCCTGNASDSENENEYESKIFNKKSINSYQTTMAT